MNVFRDGVIAFFSAVGMTTVVWLLEADIRELRRVQGTLPGARLIIADCGLTEDARGLAEYLAAREENAAVTAGPDIRLE